MAGRNVFEDVDGAIRRWRAGQIESPLRDVPGSPRPPFPCVFVSYRSVDVAVAQEAADFLLSMGLDVYFDKGCQCLSAANAIGSPLGIATCLELALDRSDSMLSITTDNTFTSPWPPYEIGSGRGRFGRPIAAARGFLPWLPAIAPGLTRAHAVAHLITATVTRVPEFVLLGVPITDRAKLDEWARIILAERSLMPKPPPAGTQRPVVNDLPAQQRAVSQLSFY